MPLTQTLATIVLTYFVPFAGAPANNSQPVAEQLRDRLMREHPGLVVRVCELPTEYDRAAPAAYECMRGLKPDLVLSLGEAFCNLKIETLGRNWDHSKLADNAGHVHRGNRVRANGPATVAFNLPYDRLVPAIRQASPRIPVVVSDDAGGFVCNHLSYELASDLIPQTRFGFIHVPKHTCDPRVRDAYEVARLIAAGLESLGSIGAAQQYLYVPSSI